MATEPMQESSLEESAETNQEDRVGRCYNPECLSTAPAAWQLPAISHCHSHPCREVQLSC